MQLWRGAYGTANIHNCSFYCTTPRASRSPSLRSGTASITLEDLAQADLVLLAGANPASNHPRLVGPLCSSAAAGGKSSCEPRLAASLGLFRFVCPPDWRSMLFRLDGGFRPLLSSRTWAPTSCSSRRCSRACRGGRG